MRVKPSSSGRTGMQFQLLIYEAAALSTRRCCKMWRQPFTYAQEAADISGTMSRTIRRETVDQLLTIRTADSCSRQQTENPPT